MSHEPLQVSTPSRCACEMVRLTKFESVGTRAQRADLLQPLECKCCDKKSSRNSIACTAGNHHITYSVVVGVKDHRIINLISPGEHSTEDCHKLALKNRCLNRTAPTGRTAPNAQHLQHWLSLVEEAGSDGDLFFHDGFQPTRV